MPQQIFVDASAWIAIADISDTHHRDAVNTYADLLSRRSILVTTDLMVAEAHIWLRRRVGHQAAMTFLDGINENPGVESCTPMLVLKRKRNLSCANTTTRTSALLMLSVLP